MKATKHEMDDKSFPKLYKLDEYGDIILRTGGQDGVVVFGNYYRIGHTSDSFSFEEDEWSVFNGEVTISN